MKKIWLINHYATNMYKNGAGRHFYFAKILKEHGYEPIIICSSFQHKGTENYVVDGKSFVIKTKDEVTFVFLKTDSYVGNGKKRIINMMQFAWRLYKNSRKIADEFGVPDVVIGSSVHPLSCVAGIKIGKKFKSKVISEIRDLWPETLITLGAIPEKGLLTNILYSGEKWIYKKSDQIIFTMEGGSQYIIDRGWNNIIDLHKVNYINNGILISQFDAWAAQNVVCDSDLEGESFKVIYTGTIAPANGIEKIVQVAKIIKENMANKIIFLIYGDGDDRVRLENYCKNNSIDNIVFKGKIPQNRIPYVLSKGDLLLVHYADVTLKKGHNVFRYGGSHNKLFEYMAAGKPILYTQKSEYNIVEKYKCGLVLNGTGTAEEIAEGIMQIYNMDDVEYENICKNSRNGALDFDFDKLTNKLIDVIEG